MVPHRYSVRKLNLFPLAKFGCLLGGLVMILPGLICAIANWQIIAALRLLLDTWESSAVDLLGAGLPVEFDFIDLLGLEAIQAIIVSLDEQRFIVALLIILSSTIGGGFLIGLTILLLGWIYNVLAMLTGGLEVELRETSRNKVTSA
jgi:hypothetical protein